MALRRLNAGLSRSGRSHAAAVAVAALVVVAGVAVYGVIRVARGGGGGPAVVNGAGVKSGAEGPRGGAGGVVGASAVLDEVEPLITSGDWGRAAALLVPAVERHPQEQELRLALARVYSGQKDWAKSYPQYEAAVLIGPESAALAAEAGTVANAAGRLDRAIEHYERAQSLDPRDPRHPLYLGMVQIKAGNEKGAMTSLYTATVLNPELGAAWGVMGELELRANRLDLALQHLEKARKLEPESVKWRLAEAKVHKRQNQPAKSLDLLINLPEGERYSADVLVVIADSLAMLKQGERRVSFLRAAKMHAERVGDDAAAERAGGMLGPG